MKVEHREHYSATGCQAKVAFRCRLGCKSVVRARDIHEGGKWRRGGAARKWKRLLTYLDLVKHRFKTKQQRWWAGKGVAGSPSERAGGCSDAPSDVHTERNGETSIIRHACVQLEILFLFNPFIGHQLKYLEILHLNPRVLSEDFKRHLNSFYVANPAQYITILLLYGWCRDFCCC